MEKKINELIEKYDGYWYEEQEQHGYPHDRHDIIIEIEKDLKTLFGLQQKKSLITAFVQGAQWWEYHQTQATMFGGDRCLAEKEAERKLADNTLGLTVEDIVNETIH